MSLVDKLDAERLRLLDALPPWPADLGDAIGTLVLWGLPTGSAVAECGRLEAAHRIGVARLHAVEHELRRREGRGEGWLAGSSQDHYAEAVLALLRWLCGPGLDSDAAAGVSDE